MWKPILRCNFVCLFISAVLSYSIAHAPDWSNQQIQGVNTSGAECNSLLQMSAAHGVLANGTSTIVDGARQLYPHDHNVTTPRTYKLPLVMTQNPFLTAAALSVLSSILQVCGVALTTRGVRSDDAWPKLGDMVMSPHFIVGVFLSTISPIVLDLAIYGLAPLSFIGPFFGLGVLGNLIIGPLVSGDKLQFWPDVYAAVIICVGMGFTSTSAPHVDRHIGLQELYSFAFKPLSILATVILGSFLLCIILVESQSRTVEIEGGEQRLKPPSKLVDASLCMFIAAGFAVFSNVALKAISEILKDSFWDALLCSPTAIVPAILQLNTFSRGVKKHSLTICYPMFSAFLTLLVTLYGMVIFEEYRLMKTYSHVSRFSFGVVLTISGIYLFHWRDQPMKLSA